MSCGVPIFFIINIGNVLYPVMTCSVCKSYRCEQAQRKCGTKPQFYCMIFVMQKGERMERLTGTTAQKVLVVFGMFVTTSVSYGTLMVKPVVFGVILQQAFINLLTWTANTRRSEASILTAIMTFPAAYFAMARGCTPIHFMIIEAAAVLSVIVSYLVEQIIED